MSSATKNIAAITCTVGTVELQGYGADGGIEIEPAEADLGEVQVSADGKHSEFSVNNNRNAIATITLMETSIAYRRLAEQVQAQQIAQAQGYTPPLAFNYLDTNGDECSTNQVFFLNVPKITGTKTAQTRVFRLSLIGAMAPGKAKFGARLT